MSIDDHILVNCSECGEEIFVWKPGMKERKKVHRINGRPLCWLCVHTSKVPSRPDRAAASDARYNGGTFNRGEW